MVYSNPGQRKAGRGWLVWLSVGLLLIVAVFVIWLVARPDDSGPGGTSDTSQGPPLDVAVGGLEDGQVLADKITITVDISDLSRVQRVEYFIDDIFAGVTYAQPFSFSLDPSLLTAGEHTLVAKAYDKSGNMFHSQTIKFVVERGAANEDGQTPAPGGGSGNTGGNNTGGGGTNPDPDPDPGPQPDTQAPSTPTNLLLSADDGYTTHISWDASTDNIGVAGYQVFRDGALLGTVLGASTTAYSDQTVVPGNTYDYTVKAFDDADNESADSTEPSITLTPTSIWLDADTPLVVSDSDTLSYEIGFKFRPLVDGQISGVRFYKASNNTGTHIGHLWTIGGTQLASATFTGESSEGWQTVTFATPVDVTANTVYVASYTLPNGHFSRSTNYFASAGITSQYLEAVASGVSGENGVYSETPGTFPDQSNGSNVNYWVDVTFIPNPDAPGPAPYTVDNSQVYDGFPGSNNTGVRKRIPTRDRCIAHNVTRANTVLENIEITNFCTLSIRADNITIRNSKLTGQVYLDLDLPGSEDWFVTIEDSEIDTGTERIGGVVQGHYAVARSNLHGGQNSAVCVVDCTVEDSWLHGQYIPEDEDWHLNGFLSNGGNNMFLRRNTISCDHLNNDVGGGCSSDISLFGDFEPITDVTIDGNLLTANGHAGYCLAAGHSATKPFGPDAANITVINNVFQRGDTNQCAAFGPFTDYRISGNPPPGSTWSNNTWDDGTPLDL